MDFGDCPNRRRHRTGNCRSIICARNHHSRHIRIGIYLSFEYFGTTTGWWVTGGSSFFFLIALVYSFKSGTWDRFSLKHSIDSKVNEDLTISLKPGDIGKALSALRPVGKAEFEDAEYEVTSLGDYVESGAEIRIIKIEVNKVFVETINQQ